MDSQKVKKGRPKKKDCRKNQYRLRMNDEEIGYLDYISGKTGYPKSQILRKSLKMYYNLEKTKD